MRKQRKESLLGQFPSLPYDYAMSMYGTGAENFCVFLTEGKELFVRCYHRYARGDIIERQRYVFTSDGFVRYIFDERTGWRIASRFREPVFCNYQYGYAFDNSYKVIGFDSIQDSDMRYSQLKPDEQFMITYLGLYCKHKNLEYIVKAGYSGIINRRCTGYWGGTRYELVINDDIDWKSNNLLKMLRLNRTEFKLLQGQEDVYSQYIAVRSSFPKYKPEENIAIAKTFGCQMGTIRWYEQSTGLTARRLARYMYENNIPLHDYNDYIRQCNQLEYDMHDTAISMPHDFYTVHERLSATIEQKSNEITQRHFKENYEGRKAFEFESGDLFLRQPNSLDEIIAEGKALCHCVGGYCERHAKGSTNIFFIRKKADPDTPYYTIEVGTDYDIIQCRGYRNDRAAPKGEEIKAFEKEYKKYLEELKNEQQRIKIRSA